MTEKIPEAVLAFMRAAGKKGGTARAKNNTKEKLSEIGKLGANKRWKK